MTVKPPLIVYAVVASWEIRLFWYSENTIISIKKSGMDNTINCLSLRFVLML